MSDEILDHAVALAKLLADRARLDILRALAEADQDVSSLAEHLGRPLPGVSQHLAKLRQGGLIESRRDGTHVVYSLKGAHVAELARHLVQHAEHLLYETPPHHQ